MKFVAANTVGEWKNWLLCCRVGAENLQIRVQTFRLVNNLFPFHKGTVFFSGLFKICRLEKYPCKHATVFKNASIHTDAKTTHKAVVTMPVL